MNKKTQWLGIAGFPIRFTKNMRRKRKIPIKIPEEIFFIFEDYFKDRGVKL